MNFNWLVKKIRSYYDSEDFIPLHAPVFAGNERQYVMETIDSTFVSSVGKFVDQFETAVAQYTQSPRAIATVNGTAALHTALLLAGVKANDLVLTQALTFIATCNAIRYCGADPIFIDVSRSYLSLCPAALADWLQQHAYLDEQGICREKHSRQRISACVPMHTFGHPADLEGLLTVCERWNVVLIEDAAESLGSLYKGQHTGTFGLAGCLSFNGNKIITTGGGGMVLTNELLGQRAKHLTTTAKQPHAYEYVHDEVGYNYRLPNLNAALGCAQLERLEAFIAIKREQALFYKENLSGSDLSFVEEPINCRANYWLHAVVCQDREQRDLLLQQTNACGVMTRPIWELMHRLPMFSHSLHDHLSCSEWLADRVVNLPSSVS